MQYDSVATIASDSAPGVTFQVYKMSFGRRIELTRLIRELAQKMEFLEAGASMQEKAEATLLGMDIERLYLEWGFAGINGLEIDGAAATREALIAAGPEQVCREILAAIKLQCGLSESERKN